MASQYADHLSTLLGHAESRNAMAPPSQPTLPMSAMYNEQFFSGGYSGGQSPISFAPHHDTNAHSWRYTACNSTPFLYHDTEAPDMAKSTRRSEDHPHSPLAGQETSGRTSTIRPNEWLRVKPFIKKIWLEDRKNLEETKTIMWERHKFMASADQYKKQIKKWHWVKNVREDDAIWMARKTNQRREENKDTTFTYHGRTLTQEEIMQRIGRKKTTLVDLATYTDMATPLNISYATPRDEDSSCSNNPATTSGDARSTWRPPSGIRRRSQPIKLLWNGLGQADYQRVYENGREDARYGHADDAETKYREALEGLHNLLWTTHRDTMNVARQLAEFYADNSRLREAEHVLEWLLDAHQQEYGHTHAKTLECLLGIVQFYQEWNHPSEAAALLDRILSLCDDDAHGTVEDGPLQAGFSARNREIRGEASAPRATTAGSNIILDNAHHFDADMTPAQLSAQIRQMEQTLPQDADIDEFWERMLGHCEDFPEQLRAQSLSIYTSLIKHHHQSGNVARVEEVIGKAVEAVKKVLRSDQSRTKDFYDTCIKLAQETLRAGWFEIAADVFSHIESNAQDTFGSDHVKMIFLLEAIGILYQSEGRWIDAAPRFEQALAACLSRYCRHSSIVKRFETTLENKHYELHSALKEDLQRVHEQVQCACND